MVKKDSKLHDLRDEIYAPRTTLTDTDEHLAGAEPPSVDPERSDFHLVRPGVGRNVPEGQNTKG